MVMGEVGVSARVVLLVCVVATLVVEIGIRTTAMVVGGLLTVYACGWWQQ